MDHSQDAKPYVMGFKKSIHVDKKLKADMVIKPESYIEILIKKDSKLTFNLN